jgi:hypothetical protein
MRGVAHEGELKGRPGDWKGFWLDVAGKSATDLATIRTPSVRSGEPLDHKVGKVATLFFALVLSAPVVFVLCLVWYG